jgi:maleylacetate reductase
MHPFLYDQLPTRVVFAPGALDSLPGEVERLHARRAILFSTPGHQSLAEGAARRLGARTAGIFPGAVMHVPADIARAALDQARQREADCLVAIGGGSTIGLAKAVALESGLAILAVPTTYSGSEMTPIYGLTEGGRKKTGRDPKVLPKVVIYDPLLTLSLPPRVTGPSGMNAIAHCVEGLYSANANPLTSLVAAEGIRALTRSLVRCVRDPADVEARSEALYGAWLSGTVLGSVGMGLHHKLCHVLGGAFGLPHAETHTIVLPHAAAYNAESAADAMAAAAKAMSLNGAADVPAALYDLAAALGAPLALREIGLKEADLDHAAALATEAPYPNPRPLSRAAIRELLGNAFQGARPAGSI